MFTNQSTYFIPRFTKSNCICFEFIYFTSIFSHPSFLSSIFNIIIIPGWIPTNTIFFFWASKVKVMRKNVIIFLTITTNTFLFQALRQGDSHCDGRTPTVTQPSRTPMTRPASSPPSTATTTGGCLNTRHRATTQVG